MSVKPNPKNTEVVADVNGGGQGGEYCASMGVKGYDINNKKSALYYCKEELTVAAVTEETTDPVPIVVGVLGGLLAAVVMAMLYSRHQNGKRHQIGNVSGARKVPGQHSQSQRGKGNADKGERILAPPPIENDSFTKEYGIEGGPQNKKSVRNPIMTENLDRHDSF
jgi:hypothetical protein